MNVTTQHKDFIFSALEQLEQYDSQRPKGHTYQFHVHSKRVATLVEKLSLRLGYNKKDARALYWATLPHDIGKINLPVAIWDLVHKPTEDEKAIRRTHTIEGANIVKETLDQNEKPDLFIDLMIDIMLNHHETMDGSGFFGKTGDQLSQEVQIVCLCDAFDGWCIPRPHFGDRDVSPPAVIQRIKTEKDGQFNKDMLKELENIIMEGPTCP